MSNSNNSDNSNSDNSDNSSGGCSPLIEYLAMFLIQSACYILLKHTFEPLVIYLVGLMKKAWKNLLEFLFSSPDNESDNHSQ